MTASFTALLGVEILRAFEEAQALITDAGAPGLALEARMSGTAWHIEGSITTPLNPVSDAAARLPRGREVWAEKLVTFDVQLARAEARHRRRPR